MQTFFMVHTSLHKYVKAYASVYMSFISCIVDFWNVSVQFIVLPLGYYIYSEVLLKLKPLGRKKKLGMK